MRKRIIALVLCLCAAAALFGCGKKKILHCDHCGGEVEVKESSNMDEDWIIYCGECNEKLFGDDPILGNG